MRGFRPCFLHIHNRPSDIILTGLCVTIYEELILQTVHVVVSSVSRLHSHVSLHSLCSCVLPSHCTLVVFIAPCPTMLVRLCVVHSMSLCMCVFILEV